MSKKIELTPVAAAVSAALTAGIIAAPAANADQNPFGLTELSSGYMVVAEEGSCGEGKCGEGKMKSEEGSCGEKKAEEASCGEKKTEEGKCGEKKSEEGSCGS